MLINPLEPVSFGGQTTQCVLPFVRGEEKQKMIPIVNGDVTAESLADSIVALIKKLKDWRPVFDEIAFETYVDGKWLTNRQMFHDVAILLDKKLG